MDTKKTSGGQEGNKNQAGYQITKMLEAKLNASDAKLKREGVDKIAQAFANGERWAVEFVVERTEGKVPTNSNVTLDIPSAVRLIFG